MRRTRVERFVEREVIYDKTHWLLLDEKRRKGVELLEYISRMGARGFIFGSVARGDVHKGSDVEIIIPDHTLVSFIDVILSQRYNVIEKEIVQATPRSAIKVTFRLRDYVEVVVPAVPLTEKEHEFYRYGGMIGLPEASDSRNRVPGVDKRLCVIVPTQRGHIEYSIIGRESEVARLLGVSPEIIEERKRMLTKRDTVGRTGTYISIKLGPDDDIARTLKALRDRDPIVRRLFRSRGL